MGRGGRFGARARALAALCLVGALLLGGLALGDRDGNDDTGPRREERDNRDRSDLKTTTTRRATTTTTTLPLGPVFGEPVGASVLLGIGGSMRWTLLDLDTGVRTEVRVRAEEPYAAVPVRDGLVVVRAGIAHLIELGPGAAAAPGGLLGTAPVPLGDADRVLGSGSPDSVWLIRLTSDFPPRTSAQLVDLTGRPLADVLEVPTEFPMGATEDGPVFGAGGRVFIAEEGGARPLAVGDLLDVAGGRMALRTCDARAICGIEIYELASGRTAGLPTSAAQSDFRSSVVLAPDGRVALFGYADTPGLVIFDADGRELGSGPAPLLRGEPSWLPGAQGLLVPSADGLRRILPLDGGLADEPIPALDAVRADMVYVIPR